MKPRGAALLLVLWLVALLTALVGAFALVARTDHMQGQVLVHGAEARAAARAGVEYAAWRMSLQDRRLRWVADGREYTWQPEGATAARVSIRIVDEQGKVDLNRADADLLSNLLQVLGTDPGEAKRIALAIVDWRDTDHLADFGAGAEDADYIAAGLAYGAADRPFDSVSELQRVLGMTPALQGRLAPNVTVYGGRSLPELAFATEPVLWALGYDGEAIRERREAWSPDGGLAPPELLPGQPLVADSSGTYSVESRARVGGTTAVLRVVVRNGGNGMPGSAWTPLRWEEGASPF